MEECRKRFNAHCEGQTEIPADLRGAVYGTVIAHGNIGDLVAMMELYRKTDHQEEKVRLMRNMGGADDQIVIERALKFAMSVRNEYFHSSQVFRYSKETLMFLLNIPDE